MKNQQLDNVAEQIVRVMDNDTTMRPQARAIAFYMLRCERLPYELICQQLEKPGARRLLERLLDCESDFMSPVSRSLGLDIVAYISADKIQKSLDVKHLQLADGNVKIDRITPVIKQTLLYNNPSMVWIRFYTNRPMDVEYMPGNVVPVSEQVYELYTPKSKTIARDVSRIITYLEEEWSANIVFCSELSLFLYNKLLFVSNYIKFMWCYVMNRDIFNPTTADDYRTLCIYMTYSMLFLKTSNLTNMPEETHNPLIAYTGERPKIAMSKFKTDRVYVVEGNRAMQTVNRGSDFGVKSHFMEIVSTVELDNSCLRNIV